MVEALGVCGRGKVIEVGIQENNIIFLLSGFFFVFFFSDFDSDQIIEFPVGQKKIFRTKTVILETRDLDAWFKLLSTIS